MEPSTDSFFIVRSGTTRKKKTPTHDQPPTPPSSAERENDAAYTSNDGPSRGHVVSEGSCTSTMFPSSSSNGSTTALGGLPFNNNKTPDTYVLTTMNRCGSTPQLPLQSAPHSLAFSSTKKRNMIKPLSSSSKGTAQLTPLSRNGASSSSSTSSFQTPSYSSTPLQAAAYAPMSLEKVKADYDRVVASYRAKQMEMERSMLDLTKQVQKERNANDVLVAETHSLKALVAQLHQQLDDERKMSMQQKKAFAKLSARFVVVNETLHKMTTSATPEGPANQAAANVKSVLNTISKENQDYQRRIKVLETQHIEDKRSLVNSEKRLKAIKTELESIEHMQMTQQSIKVTDGAAKSKPNGADGATGGGSGVSSQGGDPSQPAITGSGPSLAPTYTAASINESDPHAVISSILEQYIDPNILRILHKVDSQFSISNAINLSSTMKRWLHSCHSINTSVDIGVVLEDLMKKVCTVLQCDHAAVYVQVSNPRKLICRCTNAGESHDEVPCDKGIVSHVLTSGTPCNIANAYDDPRFYSPQDNMTGITTRDVICVPIFDHKHEAVAALRACNSVHGKGFSANDLIVLGIFGIQAGIVLQQFQLEAVLETSQTKLLRLHEMPRQLAQESMPHVENVSLIRFVLATERQFHQILGVTKFKMFLIDTTNDDSGGLMWCVGKTLDASCDTKFFRQYYKLSSGLCGLAIYHPKGLTITDPLTHAKYNGAIDLSNPVHGLYIVPILSLWGKPLGVLQVGRTVATSFRGPKVEMLEKQSANDSLKLHLISLFAQSISGILHDLMAHEMCIKCPEEIKLARMGSLQESLSDESKPRRTSDATAISEDQMKQFMAWAHKPPTTSSPSTPPPETTAAPAPAAPSSPRVTPPEEFPPTSIESTESPPTQEPLSSSDAVSARTNTARPASSTPARSPVAATSRPTTPPTSHVDTPSVDDGKAVESDDITPRPPVEAMPPTLELTSRRQSVPADISPDLAAASSPEAPAPPQYHQPDGDHEESGNTDTEPVSQETETAKANSTSRSSTPSRDAPCTVQNTTSELPTDDLVSAADSEVSPSVEDPSITSGRNPTEDELNHGAAPSLVAPEPEEASVLAASVDSDGVNPNMDSLSAVECEPPAAAPVESSVEGGCYDDLPPPVDVPTDEQAAWVDSSDATAQEHVDSSAYTMDGVTGVDGDGGVGDQEAVQYVDDPSLPAGWVAIAHGEHVYYENPDTGEQTWIKPAQ